MGVCEEGSPLLITQTPKLALFHSAGSWDSQHKQSSANQTCFHGGLTQRAYEWGPSDLLQKEADLTGLLVLCIGSLVVGLYAQTSGELQNHFQFSCIPPMSILTTEGQGNSNCFQPSIWTRRDPLERQSSEDWSGMGCVLESQRGKPDRTVLRD